MKQVPFYPNHDDGMRCMLACYMMLIEYWEHKKLSWDELIEITGYQSKKPTWSMKTLIYLKEKGYDVAMIDPFDYLRFFKEGENYLHEILSKEQLEWQLANANLLEPRPLIPKFLETIKYTKRKVRLSDIDAMLAENRLVTLVLDSHALNNQPGYADHMVLIIDRQNDNYIAHDPGGNTTKGVAYREIPTSKLWKAMGGEDTTSEVTGFKLLKV